MNEPMSESSTSRKTYSIESGRRIAMDGTRKDVIRFGESRAGQVATTVRRPWWKFW
jgi:hypothetical protein